MSQFVYTMNRVGKIVPPKREILKDISLSFFPGAKIGVLGLNGAGKSTLLRIMAGVDVEIEGEARAMPDIKIGYLPQEPALDEEQTVRENVEQGLAEPLQALLDKLEGLVDWSPEALQATVQATADDLAIGFGKIGMPLRVALMGHGQSPGIDQTLWLMGRERSVSRIRRALAWIAERAANA